MRPDAVAEFVAAYTEAVNSDRNAELDVRKAREKEHAGMDRRLKGLYDAIADGFRTAGILAQLEELERKRSQMDAELSAPQPSTVRLHPRLSELYRAKVTDLAINLQDPTIRSRALDILRGLIHRVTVRLLADGNTPVLELEGEIVAMIDAAEPKALAVVCPHRVVR